MRVEFRERCILRHIDALVYWMCFWIILVIFCRREIKILMSSLPVSMPHKPNFDVCVMSLAVFVRCRRSIDANLESGLLSKAWKNTANHI
jgi:hypothetical protein